MMKSYGAGAARAFHGTWQCGRDREESTGGATRARMWPQWLLVVLGLSVNPDAIQARVFVAIVASDLKANETKWL